MLVPERLRYSLARWGWRLLFVLVLLAIWEAYGAFVEDTWTSRPSLVAMQIVAWGRTDLGQHVATTLIEMATGLLIGVPLGSLAGILLGRTELPAQLLQPVVVAANSVPIVALAPLLIMWFGLGYMPKIALVTLVSFFLLFFNAFAGVRAVDAELLDALRLMGARRSEIFFKVVLPGTTTWLFAGLKTALPYALIAATVGEMMLARQGLGFLVTQASGQFDMTGVYAALVVLMILGLVVGELATRAETWVLRWKR